ncbi:hypothetical protein EDD76_104263 [Kineothrix alysoides]|jgi:hypothetical protein|uniref:Uncharacterized protein n=1 Tax=Kineothrix alysoides TaxID=1469948 RepID=A0A4R1R2C6_9FIRM|nr:hypothetical protein [Kineothrix alysoides]TCL59525.1 hypothetical protein EDD76_104263 [Kineothrix alysoides]
MWYLECICEFGAVRNSIGSEFDIIECERRKTYDRDEEDINR